jgi:hypothetical protein
MPTLAGMVTASGGRFVPPITVARTGLGLAAGQFRITVYNGTLNTYVLTGANTSRSGDLLTLTTTPASGTVQAFPPKGVTGSTIVNIARTPYTYYGHDQATPYCATNHHGGQCAGWGTHHTWAGPYKNAAPPSYTDSEGEWWRIW